MAAVLVVLGLLASTTSCRTTAPSRHGPPAVNSTAAAAAPSNDDLLRDARITYEKYLAAGQMIAEARSGDYTRLKPLLSDAAYTREAQSFRRQSASGIYTEGAARLVKFEMQRVDASTGLLVAYACVDLSEVRVIDKSGEDVTPDSRPNRQTFLPSFNHHQGRLIVKENGTWSGDSIC